MLFYLRFAGLQRWQSSAAAPASAIQQNVELNNRLPAQDLRMAQTSIDFNVEAMTALLDHDNHEMRAKFRCGELWYQLLMFKRAALNSSFSGYFFSCLYHIKNDIVVYVQAISI